MKVLHVNAGLETGGGLFHLINLLQVAKMQGEDFTLLTFADGPVAKAAREIGAKVETLGIESRYSRALPKKLQAFINQGNYDIVHSHGPRANLMMAKISQAITAKWAITIHSDPTKDFADRGLVGKIFEKLNLRSLKKADQLLAITNRFAKILREDLNFPAAKVSVIYNGIFFHENIPTKEEHSGFNLINVARMEPVKAQHLILEALQELQIPDIKLFFVGDGSQRPVLEELVKKYNLTDQVEFCGFLSHKEIAKLYSKMDMAVLSSESESFPLVLLEAADYQVPLLSTDVGDMNKMIPDLEHGFVVPVGDAAAIAQEIKKAHSLPQEKLALMAELEKKYLQNNFSMEQQLSSIKQIYLKMLQN